MINPVVLGFQMQICFNFTFPLDDFGKVLCLSANVLQQNSKASCREDSTINTLTILLEIHRVYMTFVAFCLLSVICKQ